MSEVNINTGFTNSNAPIFNCGIYFFDGSLDTSSGASLRAVPCSCRFLGSKMGLNDRIDAVIVYPGFKVILYRDNDYSLQDCVIDNTNKTKIIIRKVITINSIDSCKIYYQGTEIILNGISNNTLPTTLSTNSTETITT
jgi:hypothetical protein